MKYTVSFTTVVLVLLLSSCSDLPVASFIIDADSYNMGETVHFQSTCQHAETFDWDFGDGNSSTEENPTHIYSEVGVYTVRLEVSNKEGSDEASKSLSIISPCWTEQADLIESRSAHAVAEVNGRIYVMGGQSDVVEEYDPSSNTWTQKAKMSTTREYTSGCALDGKIYVIGGWQLGTGITVSTVEEYDPATDTWTIKSPLPKPRFGHASVAVDGKIYVVGGATGWPVEEFYSTIEIYDPEKDTWSTNMTPPGAGIIPRWSLSACLVNGKIFTFGGTITNRNPINRQSFNSMSVVEAYDPATNTWKEKTSMPTSRWYPAAVAVNNKIYVIGGGDKYTADTAYQIVEVYDPSTDTWDTGSPMPEGRIGVAGCELDNLIYLPGGMGNEFDNYRDLFVYDPACDSE